MIYVIVLGLISGFGVSLLVNLVGFLCRKVYIYIGAFSHIDVTD